eukprot:639691-Pyramimonas_sp.AAC.1
MMLVGARGLQFFWMGGSWGAYGTRLSGQIMGYYLKPEPVLISRMCTSKSAFEMELRGLEAKRRYTAMQWTGS